METRSGRRLTSPPPGARRRRDPRDADFIGALPDDILLLVLVRLRCVCTAVRTGLLSRRWRGLWTGLPDLAFDRIALATVESALSRFADSPAVSLLDIRISLGHAAPQANSLLRAAALLSPAELSFYFPGSREELVKSARIELPCFHRITSIELETLLCVKSPMAGEFTALERLSLRANIDDLGTLLARCPRLRVLSVTFWDTRVLCLTPPSNAEFPKLERLTLNGNIVDLGTFLNRCPRLRVISVIFRDVAPGSLQAALATMEAMEAHDAAVSLLDIRIPSAQSDDTAILRAAARLSPQQLVVFHLLQAQGSEYRSVDLPCFHRATSVKINMHNICVKRLPKSEFSVLERLSLKRCLVDDLGTLVSRCPRLRVLKVKEATSRRDITVHSGSLQELILGTYAECRSINIVTPMLKKLKMEVQADKVISVSISAPMLEKVSWRRSYTGLPTVFGFWHLQSLSLERRGLRTDKHLQDLSSEEAMLPSKFLQCLLEKQGLLTISNVLFVDMCASGSSNAELNFAQEIEKVLVTDFSVLNVRLKAAGHVYGATLLHLFSIPRVQTGMKILKVILLRSNNSEVTRGCSGNCPCDSPTTWRSQSISMPHLEEVEIKGVKGEDHEIDFLELMLRCAPSLKRMTVELGNGIRSYDYGGCSKKINSISLEYPSVDFHVYVSGRLVLHSCSSCS
ncbi:unnamed protein product [Alopecurus aequalis]